jgi:hypothetical protein
VGTSAEQQARANQGRQEYHLSDSHFLNFVPLCSATQTTLTQLRLLSVLYALYKAALSDIG